MGQYKYTTKSHGVKWSAKFRYLNPETGEMDIEYRRGFDTKREAKQYEDDFLEELKGLEKATPSPAKDSPPRRTFYQVYQEYLASHKHEDLKLSTLETKKNIFAKHIFPTFRNVRIDEITSDDIYHWQLAIKEAKSPQGKPFSEAYLRTIQCQLNSIINYANSKGYLKANPLADIKNMGVKDKRVEFWTIDEYEKFAYQAMVDPEFYYCYEVLYWCGLREGEMLALTRNDIDFDARTIRINKTFSQHHGKDIVSTPKTESSVRKVSIPDFLCDELKEYLALLYNNDPDERIFKCTKSTLTKHFRNYTELAGLKPITIHGLRHSHVSLLISKRYDIFEVSKRIGHKSVKTTQDTYGHLFDEVQKSIANDLDGMRRR